MLFTMNLEDHFKDGETFITTSSRKKKENGRPNILRRICGVFPTIKNILAAPQDADGPMKSAIPVQKTVLKWSEPMAILRFKSVCSAFGGTVNDVMLSCLYGAIRKCLLSSSSVPGGANHPLLKGEQMSQMV